MFSDNKKASPEIDTVIGSSTKIFGNIHYTGRLHIDGEIVGSDINCAQAKVATLASEEGIARSRYSGIGKQ